MVEKIKPRDSREVKDTDEFTLTGSALKKINQLIDIVNRQDPIITNLVNTSIEDGNRLLAFRDALDSIKKTVNDIQKEREAERFEIQEWIGILESVRKSVNKHEQLIDTLVEENNIHEEQIDKLQMLVEPEKCEIPADLCRLPAGATITEPEDMGYVKLDNDSVRKFLKKHPEYNNNGIIEIPKKELTDHYTEQKKWIGHLCKFWDDDDKFCFGLLSDIDKGSIYPYCCMPSETYWEHCELIKPDNMLIYKGDKDVIQ